MIKLFWLNNGSLIFYHLICKDSKAVVKILNKTAKQMRTNNFLMKVSNSLGEFRGICTFLMILHGF